MSNFIFNKGITHGGIFHADDVFSTAFLKILNPKIEINRVPFLKEENKDEETIIFDIGFGKYDHHQEDAEVRENGIKYASFGLLWREFGCLLLSEEDCQIFEKRFVEDIDKADNGQGFNILTGAISSFVPVWNEEQNINKAFWQAVGFAKTILENEFKQFTSSAKATKLVEEAYMKSEKDIVVLEQFMPWQKALIQSSAKFVIFPSAREPGCFNAQAIPPSVEEITKQKIPFPEEWAGRKPAFLNDKLEGLNFCHSGRFLISAATVEVAKKACLLAMEIAGSK